MNSNHKSNSNKSQSFTTYSNNNSINNIAFRNAESVNEVGKFNFTAIINSTAL
jgi:hypothetical protein